MAVAAVGLRLILVPLGHGQDFTVWDLASRATLSGTNIYAHHPSYLGGPYAYPPLFLYLELPLQWAALHLHLPFLVLGKLPVLGGDLLVWWIIVRRLVQKGATDRRLAVGTALFALNPLVLYNGAFYGRFDSLAVAFLLASILSSRPCNAGVLLALGVATKTFPLLALPLLLARRGERRRRSLLLFGLVLTALCLPYVVASPLRFIADTVFYDAARLPSPLSWQALANRSLSPLSLRLLSGACLCLYLAFLVKMRRLPALPYAVIASLLFLVASKLVLEQYLLWPLPFLVLLIAERPRIPVVATYVMLSTVGLLFNPFVHPFGLSSPAVQIGLPIGVGAFVGWLYATCSVIDA